MKAISINFEKCTGCDACMLACSFAHEGVFSLKKSRIWVLKNHAKAIFIPTVCESCAHIPCVYSCPTGAISYNEKLGTPIVNEQLCIGCKICERVCPYDGIKVVDGVALKCDLCGGDPECVKVCDAGAIDIIDFNLKNSKEKLFENIRSTIKRIELIKVEFGKE